MRTAIESWLTGHWYGSLRPPLPLRLLEPVYRYAFRRSQARRESAIAEFQAKTPLIVVGNITAGGTGKTPLVVALCEMLTGMGIRAGVASTGYGRHSRLTTRVKADSAPGLCGDEAVLVARRTGVPVIVAKQRIDAVKALDALGLDILISDDGLQQANLARDIEICVVDGTRGLGNGHLLPAGPLRESAERLNTVDYVVSNGDWQSLPDGLQVYPMHMQVSTIAPLDGSLRLTVNDFAELCRDKNVHAVSGIGNPLRFFDLLESLGIRASHHAFADHHPFKREDFKSFDAESLILMTEKDAVKCQELGLSNAFYMGIDALLPGGLQESMADNVSKIIEDSK